MCRRTSAWAGAVLLATFPALAGAQSAASVAGRVAIDGDAHEYAAVEAVFRNAPVCNALSIAPCPEEEPDDDSAWSALQDIEQIYVTWDAQRLVLAARGRIAGHVLILALDYRAGGAREMANLTPWRRAVRFGPDLRPDAFVAVRDGARTPELFRVRREEALEPVPIDAYEGVASFAGEARGRALEISIPWSVLFPDAPLSMNPDSLGPSFPQFELPADARAQGLRLAAFVAHADEGLSVADVAPDASVAPDLDTRTPVVVDRAARVQWDADDVPPPHFVDFGVAVQTQAVARFVPEAPAPAPERFTLIDLATFRADAPQTTSRVLFPEADVALGWGFRVSEPAPATLYISARIYSMRGDLVAEVVRDEARACGSIAGPYGCFGNAARDRWDGRDRHGARVPGGMYLLRVTAGLRPGIESTRAQRTIAVVD